MAVLLVGTGQTYTNIATAIAAANGGDTVRLTENLTTSGLTTLGASHAGSTDSYITIDGDGYIWDMGNGECHLSGASWLHFTNMEVKGDDATATRTGFRGRHGSHHFMFTSRLGKLSIHDFGTSAIGFHGVFNSDGKWSHVLVEDVDMYSCGNENQYSSSQLYFFRGGGDASGNPVGGSVAIETGASGPTGEGRTLVVVRGCQSYDSESDYQGSAGTDSNGLIMDNIDVADTGGSAMTNVKFYIYNNVFSGNYGRGCHLLNMGSGVTGECWHNTVYENLSGFVGGNTNAGLNVQKTAANMTLRNNIAIQSGTFKVLGYTDDGVSQTGNTWGPNARYGTTYANSGSVTDANDYVLASASAAGFVNAASQNFDLTPGTGSAVLDVNRSNVACPSYITTDLLGRTRDTTNPVFGAYDPWGTGSTATFEITNPADLATGVTTPQTISGTSPDDGDNTVIQIKVTDTTNTTVLEDWGDVAVTYTSGTETWASDTTVVLPQNGEDIDVEARRW